MSPRPLAGPRLHRVLALVPYVLTHPYVTTVELAARFEIPEEELERELELLLMCGLPPYTADRLIDVAIVDGEVSIRLAEYFERPLRLTPAEGLALLAAGRALLAVPGSDPAGPLATALDKLDEVLGARGRLAVDVGGGGWLEQLSDAAATRSRVEIDYYSASRGETTTRRIDPWRVFHAFGAWYVAAWCHASDDERLFRVDRVLAVRDTGEHFDEPPPREGHDGPESVYSPRPEDPRAVLRVAPEVSWVVESYPHEGAHRRRDGSWRVVLPVSEPAWLERLLLVLGPAARVEGPRDLVDAAPAAARRVRARYGDL